MDAYIPVVVPSRKKARRQKRRGSIVVLSAFLMIVMVACVALAVDLGYLYIARTEAQASADSAALAAAWEIIGEERLRGDLAYETNARNKAIQFAGLNTVAALSQSVDGNWSNNPDGEVVIGRIDDYSNRTAALILNDPQGPNAVTVRVRRTTTRNGEVNLFFARALGIDSGEITAEATATFRDDIRGFRVTNSTGNATLMPFVVHEDDWAALLAGNGNDDWSYTPSSSSNNCNNSNVSSGPDRILEMNMFPQRTNGNHITPGNFGTVNFDDSNNSASTMRRIIRNGPSAADLASHGGTLELDPTTGTLELGGDPGISASMKDALADIVGQPRTIMLYRTAVGQGNTTRFTIVGFVGIRVMDYSLTGGNKYITIQPAFVVDSTAVVGGNSPNSYFIGQPIHLAR